MFTQFMYYMYVLLYVLYYISFIIYFSSNYFFFSLQYIQLLSSEATDLLTTFGHSLPPQSIPDMFSIQCFYFLFFFIYSFFLFNITCYFLYSIAFFCYFFMPGRLNKLSLSLSRDHLSVKVDKPNKGNYIYGSSTLPGQACKVIKPRTEGRVTRDGYKMDWVNKIIYNTLHSSPQM